jgi:hypothetical protein
MIEITIVTVSCALVLISCGMELQKILDRRRKSGGLR